MGTCARTLALALVSLTLLCGTSWAVTPTEFNLIDELGVAPPVKNQGPCGSCWAVATTSAVEWILLRDGQWAQLGPQALVDCEPNSFGCGGGYTVYALEYLETAGAPLETDYPYTGQDGTCQAYEPYAKVTDSSYQYSRDDEAIMDFIYTNLTPAVSSMIVHADFEQYTNGVYEYDGTSDYRGSKAVQIIGWGTEAGVPYWLCENTWGPDWGEQWETQRGYFRIKRGDSNIGDSAYFAHGAVVVGQPANQPPVADAGSDQAVPEGAQVTLDGSGSFDPEGDVITYSWEQIGGPSVSLDVTDPVHPIFTAPLVGIAGEVLAFELTVSDGTVSATDSIQVAVDKVNQTPEADAGSDQLVIEGSLVVLDGSGSGDPDGDALAYLWTQLGGPSVTLDESDPVHPAFVAPAADPSQEPVRIQLVVNDGQVDSDPDQVVITLVLQGDPPTCDQAFADPDGIWPPNHKFVPVQILGVTAHDGGPVALTIDSVFQDEPLNAQGDGNSSPDAVIDADGVSVLAERSGQGNGRVYHIGFTAHDAGGSACQGSVSVCVPHSKKDACGDEGPLHESTGVHDDGEHELEKGDNDGDAPGARLGCATPGTTGGSFFSLILLLGLLWGRTRVR